VSLVQIAHLTRRFADVTAVDDLSIGFDAGQIFGFIGPNGAGKTTAMRILAGLDEPTSGSCTVDGLDTVNQWDAVARIVGYMPDRYGAYPNMTVFEYLDFFARAYGLRAEARRRAVADVAELCQLGGLAGKPVAALSKGMKQRLCLGRALIHEPRVLILDEPAAGLDPRARIELRELIRILASQGKAVFISSHILADLQELCDAVAILELGKLVATGSVAAITHEVRLASEAHAQRHGQSVMLELRLATTFDAIERVLAEQPDLAEVRPAGPLSFSMEGPADPVARAALLKRLILAEVPVAHFATRDHDLEDAFMHLTEGRVQ
jgi:ABC-2 type transport system ATP-binding protein